MNPFTESTVARPLSDSAAAASGAESRPTDSCTNTWPAGSVTAPVSPEPYADPESAASWDTACVADSAASIHAATEPSIRHGFPQLIGVDRRPGKTVACPLRCNGSMAFYSFASLMYRKKHRSFLTAALKAVGLAASLTFGLPAAAAAVDVNAATQAQLEAVRGIGPKTAEIIIQERTRGGQYESFEDLSDRVKGIGPKKAASLQAAGLTLGQSAGSEAAAGNATRPSALLPASPASQGRASVTRRSPPGKAAATSGGSSVSKRLP